MATSGGQPDSQGKGHSISKKPDPVNSVARKEDSSALKLYYFYDQEKGDRVNFRFKESGSDYEGVFTVGRSSTPETPAILHRSQAIPKELWNGIKDIKEKLNRKKKYYRVKLVKDKSIEKIRLDKFFDVRHPSQSTSDEEQK